MYGINLQLFNSKLIEYHFLTMCLKSYIFRKTYGFAQIAQKNCARLKLIVSCATFAKNISGLAQIAQKNSAKLIAFHAQKQRKSSQKKNLRENSLNFAQKIQPFRGNPTFPSEKGAIDVHSEVSQIRKFRTSSLIIERFQKMLKCLNIFHL